jgi:hypothetical protein
LCWFPSTHSGAPSAYTLAYPAVLTIVHLDGTSILSLYNSRLQQVLRAFKATLIRQLETEAYVLPLNL